jgi:3-oxoacyl-[acyl-carrier-protein] synthase II
VTRLWITGVGLATALGIGVEQTWARLLRGERGIGPVDLFDTSGQRSTIAAQTRGLVVPRERGWSRTGALALVAAREAIEQARIEPRATRAGLVVAGTTGGMFEAEALLARLHKNPGERDAWAELFSHPLTSPTDRLEETLGPFVRARTLTSACSSGANALVVAAHWLLSGEVDVVVAGGSDGLCRLTFTGFNALAAIDPEPCRPFDRRRKGLNLGEGAGFVVLERAERAEARGASPVAELAGWSVGAEAHHITNPEPSGATAARLVSSALARAKLTPADVDYVNAHGTATPLNDPMESAALARALGAEIERVPVSSSKGQIGHTLGAAGAIEAVISALAVARQAVPPTAGLDEPDPACALVHVPHVGRDARVRAAVSTSFGFGGMDAVLVVTEPGFAPPLARPRRGVVVTGAMTFVPRGAYSAWEGARILDGDATGKRIDESALAALDPARARRLDRASRLGVRVAQGALESAGISPARVPENAGIVLSSAFGWVDGSAAFMSRVFDKGPRLASPADFPNLVPSSPMGHVSIYLGLRGPALGTADLTTSAESALAQGIELVEAGEADLVVAGGLEELTDIVDKVMAALFDRADEHRSEAVTGLVLEAEETARARGAKVLARVERVLAWRSPPASLALPAPTASSRVVLSRHDAEAERILAQSGWGGVPRDTCAPAVGEHEALGGIAVAIAVARLAAGTADRIVVVGQAPGRGYALALAR